MLRRTSALLPLVLPVVVSPLLLGEHGAANEGNTYLTIRTMNGAGNNLDMPDLGAAETPLVRLGPKAYGDGTSSPSGADRPNPRSISNTVVAQSTSIVSAEPLTDFVWQWGQFLDHDLDLAPVHPVAEPFDIPVPAHDPWFDPGGTGDEAIGLDRSFRTSGHEQKNVLSAFIDASQVYGSQDGRADWLRLHDGTGRLKSVQNGQYLPYNTDGLENGGGPDPSLYVAGDVRVNEQIGLIAMHTLFMREHNRWADIIHAEKPWLSDEDIFQEARKIVGAEMQIITYEEWLPIVLGPDALPPYEGYKPDVDPSVSNEFATAAFRFGHSLLSPTLRRVDWKGDDVGSVELRDAFFHPELVPENGGIDSLLRGLASQRPQEVDPYIVDGVRNFLFGPPGQGGFDLASLNIQRGRDHGLPSYNATRVAIGLSPVSTWAAITSSPEMQAKLEEAYGDVSLIDLWVGGLAEDHVPGALVGETFFHILRDQFTRARDGDRFWYENDPYFTPARLAHLKSTRLSRIIRKNTQIGRELQLDVFHLAADPTCAEGAAGAQAQHFKSVFSTTRRAAQVQIPRRAAGKKRLPRLVSGPLTRLDTADPSARFVILLTGSTGDDDDGASDDDGHAEGPSDECANVGELFPGPSDLNYPLLDE